jgi:hypothetical protein
MTIVLDVFRRHVLSQTQRLGGYVFCPFPSAGINIVAQLVS